MRRPETVRRGEPSAAGIAGRNAPLTEALLARLPPRPRLVEIGPVGAGLFRSLAPVVGRALAWMLVDPDEGRLGATFEEIARWADERGWTVTWPGRALVVHTGVGAWRVEGVVEELSRPPARIAHPATDAVLCGDLLGHVSSAWLGRLATTLHTPFLAIDLPTGRDRWAPSHPADLLIARAQRRAGPLGLGGDPPLGAAAPGRAVRALVEAGLAVRSAPSDLLVPRGAVSLGAAVVQSAAETARAAAPHRSAAIAEWEAARLRQALAGKLAIRLGRRDILADPS